MSILSDFEDRVGRVIEGVFAGVFRSPVQPAELARAASKEMDRQRKLGVGKVYAPTMYSILLSPEDGAQLGGFADTLAGELETYLLGYAHEHDYETPTRPRVRFLVDEELRLGRFEVIGELLSPEEIAAEFAEEAPAPSTAFAENDVFAEETAIPPSRIATVTVPGIAHDVVLRGQRMTVGRLKSCDIVVQDANVSREHFALVHEGGGWLLTDLDSTNGTLLNGSPAVRARLADGDIIGVGVTELVYHEPGS